MKALKGIIGMAAVVALLCLPATNGYGFEPIKDGAQIAAAFMTNLAMHEVGHAAVGSLLGAQGEQPTFFRSRNGSFFLGHTGYSNLRREGRLPFAAGGAMLNGYTFEYALADFERDPNTYNKALIFFSCTDFLYYSVYALYVAPENEYYDPMTIKQETGLSKEAILGIALTQTILNGMRVFKMQDKIIPYIQVDRFEASFNVMVRF
jgi:hypothetical protein